MHKKPASTPASSPSYLQDRLQAQRAHSKRYRRSDLGPRANRHSALNDDDDVFLAEAEAAAATPSSLTKHTYDSPSAHRASSSSRNDVTTADGDGEHRGLGVRELDKHIDKLSKLNFDLKMELFYCREKMAKLHEECSLLTSRAQQADEAAVVAEHDRVNMIEVNQELVKELEKRDEAVREAVDIICDLEEKLERIEKVNHQRSVGENHRSLDRSHQRMDHQSPPASLALAYSSISGSTRPQKRVPSFLCERKPSTNALRSVYLEPATNLNAVTSYASLRSQRESRTDDLADLNSLDSPHLSVLSESSFPTIYGLGVEGATAHESTNQHHDAHEPAYNRFQNDNDRIKEWIANRTPEAPNRREVLSHATGRRKPDLHYQPPSEAGTTDEIRSLSTHRKMLRGPSYGERHLPPTPESASTCMLQESRCDTQSDDEEAEETIYGQHSDAASSTIRDDGEVGYATAYPNGGSILTGTPSRFQIRHAAPPATNILFDGDGIDKIVIDRSQNRRRNTVDDEPLFTNKDTPPRPRPSLPRSETSPSILKRHTPIQRRYSTEDIGDASDSGKGKAEYNNAEKRRGAPAIGLRPSVLLSRSPEASSNPTLPTATNTVSGGHGSMRASIAQRTQKLFRRKSEASRKDVIAIAASPLRQPSVTSDAHAQQPVVTSLYHSPGVAAKQRPSLIKTQKPADHGFDQQRAQTQTQLYSQLSQQSQPRRLHHHVKSNNPNNNKTARSLSQDNVSMARVAPTQALIVMSGERRQLDSSDGHTSPLSKKNSKPSGTTTTTTSGSRGLFRRAGSLRM